jgi:hypothetical protein
LLASEPLTFLLSFHLCWLTFQRRNLERSLFMGDGF